MINRNFHVSEIKRRFRTAQVVGLLGPRQCGKTTLAKSFKSDLFFDLENPEDLQALDNPAQAFLGAHQLIIIDEVQRKPELFAFLRYYVDKNKNAKFLILGSASRDLINRSSESLSGRISYYHLFGFSLPEVTVKKQRALWLRGAFPKSFLAKKDSDSFQWLQDYTRTFLEQDIPQLGVQVPANTLRRFWSLLAHYNSQILSYSEIGRVFGVADTTIRKYIDILSGTFMVEVIPPWIAFNISKRQVKSPKFYFKDTGIFHLLYGIKSPRELISHPKLGASWESFVLQNLRYYFSGDVYFWNTQSGAEIDFLFETEDGMVGVEAKFSEAPALTASINIALKDLNLRKIYIVYPGEKNYFLNEFVQVVSLLYFLKQIKNKD